MPRVKEEVPANLRPYITLGVDLEWDSREAHGDCPFCGKIGKFFVKVETSEYQCKSCMTGSAKGGGNSTTFVQKLHQMLHPSSEEAYENLAADRGLMSGATLKQWGLVFSPLTHEWLFPAYSATGSLLNLFRYVDDAKSGKRVLRSTGGLNVQVFGVPLLLPSHEEVWVVESWNAPALWEVLGVANDGTTGVIGAPGCNVWQESWCKMLAGKRVVFAFDSDRERTNRTTGKVVRPAGLVGTERASLMLSASPTPPESISYLQWGPDGFDVDQKDGWDVRDELTQSPNAVMRVKALEGLRSRVVPVPDEWTSGSANRNAAVGGGIELRPVVCSSWSQVVNALRQAIKSRTEIEDVFSVMLATATSTSQVGDQVFLMVVADAGCLHAETPIHDPVSSTTMTVQERWERGEKFHVWSREDDGSVEVREALPPHKFSSEPMHRVTLRSGAQVTVTAAHQFYAGDGRYLRLSEVQDALRECGVFRLPSISEHTLSARGQDALYSTRTTGDSRSCCSICSCRYDAPLQLVIEYDRGVSPSQVGVQECNHSETGDALASTLVCTLLPGFDHPSTLDYQNPASTLEESLELRHLIVDTLEQTGDSTSYGEHTPKRINRSCRERLPDPVSLGPIPWSGTQLARTSGCTRTPYCETHRQQPQCLSSTSQTCTRSEFLGSSSRLVSSASQFSIEVMGVVNYHNDYDEIVKIEEAGTHEYYDFHVPKTENYWACGVFHHNSAKTRLCDAMLVSKRCFPLEDFNSLYSGYKGKDGEDYSLIDRINHLTLITPEADVIMSSLAFDSIMSQFRRVFDGKGGKTFGNSTEDKRLSGLRTPWIMAGTPAMLDKNQSRLGDRFIKVFIRPPTDDEKKSILKSVGYSALRSVLQTSNGDSASSMEENMREFYQLTGGYVDWLRDNMSREVNALRIDEEAVIDACADLAEFSAMLRARPAPTRKDGGETHDTKELPSRLTHQFTRLACCLAVVLNRKSIDADVMRRVKKVAIDTASGRTLEIARYLNTVEKGPYDVWSGGDYGRFRADIAQHVNMGEDACRTLIIFLKGIDVVKPFRLEDHGPIRWKLTEKASELWKRVMGPT